MRNTNREDIPCVMALFGASGDVTRRKLMPAIFKLWRDGELPETFSVAGFGRSPKTDETFREEMRQGIREHSEITVSQSEWTTFGSRLHYVTGRYDSVRDMDRFHRDLTRIDGSGTGKPVLYYLALPPSAAEQVLRTMTEAISVPLGGSRIMMEKPFGLDLAGAQRMNSLLSELFPEERIYRVDHFLAKDIVRALVDFRFANWRWQGVPFYVRSGKVLARKTTEIAIQFKSLPFCILEQCSSTCTASPNVLFIRIQPTEGMTLQFNIRGPGHEGRMVPARLDFHYTSMDGQPVEPYESVILDALLGRPTLFWRGDGIEAAWNVVAPMLVEEASDGKTYPNYARSSWGPPSADKLLLRDGRHWLSSAETD